MGAEEEEVVEGENKSIKHKPKTKNLNFYKSDCVRKKSYDMFKS